MLAIRCRTGVVGVFRDGESAVVLIGVRLRLLVSTHLGTRKYMSMDLLKHQDMEARFVA